MSLKALLLLGVVSAAGFASAASASSSAEGKLRVRLDAREIFVSGEPFVVQVELSAVGGEVDLEGWRLTPACIEVDGKPLSPRRDKHSIALAEGDSIELRFDLRGRLDPQSNFELTCAGSEANPVEISALQPAAKELDFMSIPAEELSAYRVFLHTNRGDMLHEMWPHLAPNHVRNFLDLAHTGFYNGTTFHRTGIAFMIQGGDPTGTGGGSGPRQVKAEFSREPHVRGILSMARGGHDVNSASCQFFVMHGTAPGLDEQYSVFGKMLIGYDVLDAIVSAPGQVNPRDGTIRPTEPQVIERAVVVLANNEKK